MKKIAYLFLAVILAGFVLSGSQCGSVLEPPTLLPQDNTLSLYGTDPLTLDPAVSAEIASHEYILQIYSGLVSFDENLKLVPDIAKEWEISSDGRVYTFHLRDDVQFHDGKKVTAADFKYSWERACNPFTNSQTASTYLGDIVGVDEVLAGRQSEIRGVKVIDDYTLQVTIDEPKSYFLSKLAYATAFVIDKANAQSGGEWWRKPNGTGPFKLRQWDENSLLVLEKNGSYYGEKAKIDFVAFQLLSGVPMNLYETGEIDVAPVSVSYIDRVTDKSGPFYNDLEIFPELSFSYIGFDYSKPPFNDAKIRRAFSMAINKDRIASLVFRNMIDKAGGILPPGMPGYNKSLSGLDFNIAEAKRLIAESEYGSVENLPPITITDSGWGGLISQDLESIIYEWRRNLGVDVKVRQLEPQIFLYNLKEEKDNMYVLGWVADYPHPQDFLDILFHSGNENNYGEYSNSEVDSILEKAAIEQNSELSLKLYQQAEQKLVDDAACLPLWFGQSYILVKPFIKGYTVNPLGYAMLNKVSFDFR